MTEQQQQQQPLKRRAKDLVRHLSKEDVQMDNKHMKRY